MQMLTCVERLVLESLGSSPKDMKALMRDTQLEMRFLANILQSLTLRSYVVHGPDGYRPNQHLPSGEMRQLNHESCVRLEALELIEGLCKSPDKKIGLRKAWMSEKDRAILRALLKNVEDFVQSLPAPPKQAPLHEYTLVVWGEDQYGQAINRLIGGVV